jgi:uncharacterized protein YukE
MCGEFKANFDALSSDAGQWDSAASDTAKAVSGIADVAVAPSAFTGRAAEVAEKYQNVCTRFGDYLRAGKDVVQTVGDTLREVRREYESNEQDIAGTLAHTWSLSK